VATHPILERRIAYACREQIKMIKEFKGGLLWYENVLYSGFLDFEGCQGKQLAQTHAIDLDGAPAASTCSVLHPLIPFFNDFYVPLPWPFMVFLSSHRIKILGIFFLFYFLNLFFNLEHLQFKT
jgi:hypothetical protein